MAKQHPGPNSKHLRPIGGYKLSDQPLELNAGWLVTEVVVQNTGDRVANNLSLSQLYFFS